MLATYLIQLKKCDDKVSVVFIESLDPLTKA